MYCASLPENKGEECILEALEQQKCRKCTSFDPAFCAYFNRGHSQQIIERVLNRLVTSNLIALEPAARKLKEAEQLRQEVDSKVVEPTEAEISFVYESNKDRIPDPKDKAIERIKQSLSQQRK